LLGGGKGLATGGISGVDGYVLGTVLRAVGLEGAGAERRLEVVWVWVVRERKREVEAVYGRRAIGLASWRR
jgi:hypothetical protein